MFNISPEILEELKEKMKMPEGAICWKCPDNFIHSENSNIEVISGKRVLQIFRTNNLIKLIYSSPGIGTLEATTDIQNIINSKSYLITAQWSHENISIHIGDNVNYVEYGDGLAIWSRLLNPQDLLELYNGSPFITSEGVKSDKLLYVGKSGTIYSVRDEGVSIMGLDIIVDGKPELQSTAIDSWNDTKKAIEILRTGESSEENKVIFETIQTNIIISTLVTGFEVYCERRALELEQEGIVPNIRNFFREEDQFSEIKTQAKREGVALFEYIIRNKVSFQNYDRCKEFYSKIYGIKFGDLQNVELGELKRIMGFRHKIIHEKSIIFGFFNQEFVPLEKPIFSNRATANKAIETFDSFIHSLHQATLELRPNNNDLQS